MGGGSPAPLRVGSRVQGQYYGHDAWYPGVIAKVNEPEIASQPPSYSIKYVAPPPLPLLCTAPFASWAAMLPSCAPGLGIGQPWAKRALSVAVHNHYWCIQVSIDNAAK